MNDHKQESARAITLEPARTTYRECDGRFLASYVFYQAGGGGLATSWWMVPGTSIEDDYDESGPLCLLKRFIAEVEQLIDASGLPKIDAWLWDDALSHTLLWARAAESSPATKGR